MWIYVPNLTSSPTSPSAPEAEAWTSASSWQSQALAQSAWWRGKPSLAPIWSRRCAKVSWLQRLCGAMPEPSVAELGVAAWTASLAASRASLTASPGGASARPMSATSGAPRAGSSCSPAPGGSSSRTSPACSPLEKTKRPARKGSGETYSAWVSRLREDCSRRRRLARPTSDSAFSSSPWPTPDAGLFGDSVDLAKNEARRERLKATGVNGNGFGVPLAVAARTFPVGSAWPTPAVIDAERDGSALRQMTVDAGERGARKGISLHHEVANWPTPAARDYRSPNSQDSQDRRNDGSSRGQQLPNFVEHMWSTPAVADVTGGRKSRSRTRSGELLLNGQAASLSGPRAPTTPKPGETSSTSGLQLNPLFVEWLMGWPAGWTLFECSATELSRFKRRMRSELSRLVSPPAAPPAQLNLFGG